jgi:hypothetical protein
LTAFNHNAAIIYLSSLVSEFATNPSMQKAVQSGAVKRGRLTVIANAPNPAGKTFYRNTLPVASRPLVYFSAR